MPHAYKVTLLLLLGYYAYGATINNGNQPMNAMDRVRNFLEERCLKYAGQLKHQDALQALNHLTKDCFPFKPQTETIGELRRSCQVHNEYISECVIAFAEKLEPCLDPKETFLKKFIVDTFNKWTDDSCQQVADLFVTAIMKPNMGECVKKFKEQPEISPHVACYKNSTMIGDGAATDAVKAEKLCSELQDIDSCYANVFEQHCPGNYEIEDIQKSFITAGLKNCKDVLQHATAETSEDTTKWTHATNTI